MKILLFEEQKYCNNGSPGWKCNGSERRKLRKGKIIAMTFSLNEEGAIPCINRVTTYTEDYYFDCINTKFLSEFDITGKNIIFYVLSTS